MNDPHVERLLYKFKSENENDQFDEAEALKTIISDWEVELVDGELTAKPNIHFPNAESARIEFDDILNSWESAALLDPGRYRISFQYKHAEIIDRQPTPGVVTLSPATLYITATTGNINLIHNIKNYPAPKRNFVSSPLTDELIGKIKKYLDGRNTLAGMGYWFFTILKREYGNRENVSRVLNFNEKVLSTLGRITESSDPDHGRKAIGKGPEKYSENEKKWIEEALFMIVNRIGEINAGVKETKRIFMSDLPPLDDNCKEN